MLLKAFHSAAFHSAAFHCTAFHCTAFHSATSRSAAFGFLKAATKRFALVALGRFGIERLKGDHVTPNLISERVRFDSFLKLILACAVVLAGRPSVDNIGSDFSGVCCVDDVYNGDSKAPPALLNEKDIRTTAYDGPLEIHL